MQVIGSQADVDMLAASAAFERIQPWHDSYQRCIVRSLTG
jgi:amidase/aspartyl-tRNA(Asn)/glutamyl-tRNA(Gln) amidotransferase subunit A